MTREELNQISERIEAVSAAGEWSDDDAVRALADRRALHLEVIRLRTELNDEYGHDD